MLKTIMVVLVVTSFAAPALAIPRGVQVQPPAEQGNQQTVAKSLPRQH
jgi:hypothetical protein